METSNRIEIASAYEPLFAMASDIARWPSFLPHYRWVTILEQRGSDVRAEMAARHLGVPLWWRTIQTVKPEQKRIEFTHIGGITKGMTVQWTFDAIGTAPDPQWLVQIHHQFDPRWPAIIGPWFAHRVVGKLFVQQVASKTLSTIKGLLEKNHQGSEKTP